MRLNGSCVASEGNADTALRLAQLFETTPFWMHMQVNFDLKAAMMPARAEAGQKP